MKPKLNNNLQNYFYRLRDFFFINKTQEDFVFSKTYYLETPDNTMFCHYDLESNKKYIFIPDMNSDKGFITEEYDENKEYNDVVHLTYENHPYNNLCVFYEGLLYLLRDIKLNRYFEQFVSIVNEDYKKEVIIHYDKHDYFKNITKLDGEEDAVEVANLIRIPSRISTLTTDSNDPYTIVLSFPYNITEITDDFVYHTCKKYYNRKSTFIIKSRCQTNVYSAFSRIEREKIKEKKEKLKECCHFSKHLKGYEKTLIHRMYKNKDYSFGIHSFVPAYWKGCFCALQLYDGSKTLHFLDKVKGEVEDTVEVLGKETTYSYKKTYFPNLLEDLLYYGKIKEKKYSSDYSIKQLNVEFKMTEILNQDVIDNVKSNLQNIYNEWSDKLKAEWKKTRISRTWEFASYVPDYIRDDMDTHKYIVELIDYPNYERCEKVYYEVLLERLKDSLIEKMSDKLDKYINDFEKTPFNEYDIDKNAKYFKGACNSLFKYFKEIKSNMNKEKAKGFYYDW